MEAAEALAPRPAAGNVRAIPSMRRLLAHVRTPLHRDGYALVLNSVFTAGTGVIYWVIAAKLYSPHSVGLNSALVSSMMFLAGLAGLNLVNILVRFLPDAGRRTVSVIAWSYAATGLLAAVAALVFLAGVHQWAPKLGFLVSSPLLAAWFVLASVAWCVFSIQDGVLTALGRAVWVPVENAIFSLLKIGLLLAAAALLPLYGVFVSWTAAMLLSVIGVNAVVFARLARQAARRAPRRSALAERPALARYLGADYVGSLAWLASANLVPVIVTGVAGATTNAYYALAWAVALPLYSVAGNIGTSLVLHGTRDRTSLPALTRKALFQGASVLIPAVVLLLLLAPTALSVFGHSYSEHGATVLRLLAIAALPNLVLTLILSVARVTGRLGGTVTGLTLQAALLVGLVAPMLHALGVEGVGVAWLVSQTVAVVALLGAWALGILKLPLFGRPSGTPEPGVARLIEAELTANRSGRPLESPILRRLQTDSDTAAFLVERPLGGEPVVVKLGRSEAGAAALTAHHAALADLHSVRNLNGWTAILPQIVASGTTRHCHYVVEGVLPGVDGRSFATSSRFELALAATARGMAGLYEATALDRKVEGPLFDGLVRDRVEAIALARGPRALKGLTSLSSDLFASLAGRRVPVGRVHGDLWLGNALLSADASTLTGLVDWDASRRIGLPAVDLMHLVVSTRSLRERRQLGSVVRRMLHGRDELTRLESELLDPYMPQGHPEATRAVVLLAWLQHVSQRIAQSGRSPRAHWMLRNVDPVLAELES